MIQNVSKLGLISCVCVTRNRPHLLHRAITCFNRQTYECRELVVLCEDDDVVTRQCVEQFQATDPRIRLCVVGARPKLPLGTLRNLAVKAARGDFVCQWDDDDWHHSDRLKRQSCAIERTDKMACVLDRWIIFDETSQQAYWSGRRAWEGSVLVAKSAIIPYPALVRGEDTPVIADLLANRKLVLLDAPELYVYIFHGRNTWNSRHWRRYFRDDRRVSTTLNQQIIADLNEDIGKFDYSFSSMERSRPGKR